jgi:hypothetical protein
MKLKKIFANRAYLFDNSKNKAIWLAEITDGKLLELKTKKTSLWLKKFLLDRINLNQ